MGIMGMCHTEVDHLPKLLKPSKTDRSHLEDMYFFFSNCKIYIYIININIYYDNKGKYIRSNDGALTRWRRHVINSLHSPIT